MTTSDEDPIFDDIDEQIVYDYETPTEEDEAAGQGSVQVVDDDVSQRMQTDDNDQGTDNSRNAPTIDERVANISRQMTDGGNPGETSPS